jgi:chromosome segregation ATPase
MKKTIYTLLFTTTMMPAIALASTNIDELTDDPVIADKLRTFVATDFPATPDHIHKLATEERKYDAQSPFTQQYSREKDIREFRREKASKVAVMLFELESEKAERKNAENLAVAEEQYRQEHEQLTGQLQLLTLKIGQMTLDAQRVTEELEDLQQKNLRLEETCVILEGKKSEIEEKITALTLDTSHTIESRNRNMASLKEELESTSKGLEGFRLQTIKLQTQVRKLEDEKRAAINTSQRYLQDHRLARATLAELTESQLNFSFPQASSAPLPALTVPTISTMTVSSITLSEQASDSESDGELNTDLTGGI